MTLDEYKKWVEANPINSTLATDYVWGTTTLKVPREKPLQEFADAQEPLGAEFEALWDANVEQLYEE
jgi:hypothetical protein